MPAGDLTCPGTAITITADGVRLDPGGHALAFLGPDRAEFGEAGIVAVGTEAEPVTGLRVANGAVAGFSKGVRLAFAPGARLAGVTASGSGINGADVGDPPGARVVGNAVLDSGSTGTAVEGCEGCELSGNRADRNSVDGINAGGETPRARFAGNTATGNGSHGTHVDDCDGRVVSGNTATGNGEDGIEVAAGSTGNRLDGNRASGNGTAGRGDFVLRDGNLSFGDPPGCYNAWRGNRFVTDNEGDRPAAGCIR